jgi:DnaJ-class molecular chaperone
MLTPVVERDLYERLNVDPSASSDAVRSAYRLLAHRLHPDRNASPAANGAMVELNHAYAILRDPTSRATYDHERAAPIAVVTPQPSGRDAAGRVLVDFGRYQGWALEDIARKEPEYLEWLKRHSSGPRYRQEINRVLDARERAAVVNTRASAGAWRR